jgi:hypothetical protein
MKKIFFLAEILASIAISCGGDPSNGSSSILDSRSSASMTNDPSPAESKIIEVDVRMYRPATKKGGYNTEDGGWYEFHKENFKVENMALVLMDVWETGDCQGFHKRVEGQVQNYIVPLIDKARNMGLKVIYLRHGFQLSRFLNPLPEEMIFDDEQEFKNYISANQIGALLYAGYALNMCVMYREEGMVPMSRSNIRSLVLRDCTKALETAETLPYEGTYTAIMNQIDLIWGTTDSRSFGIK